MVVVVLQEAHLAHNPVVLVVLAVEVVVMILVDHIQEDLLFLVREMLVVLVQAPVVAV
jgi:hypothetical protein